MDLRDHAIAQDLWQRDSRKDNQSEASACRPILHVARGTLEEVRLPHKAGGRDAFRYPAAARWTIADGEGRDHQILLVSLHATSGFAGAKSTQGLLDAIDQKLTSECPTYLVGADFNSYKAKWGPLEVPSEATHQSGHVLDGFYANNLDVYEGTEDQIGLENVTIEVGPFGLSLGPGSMAVEGAGPVPPKGCYFGGQRISDHRPVSAKVMLRWEDEDESGTEPGEKRSKRLASERDRKRVRR